MSRFLFDAVVTEVGYAHPLTGELLSTKTGLADPVAYYKPNARQRAFIAPDTVDCLVMFKRNRANDKTVRFALQTVRNDVATVDWNFDDGTTLTGGGKRTKHTFSAAGTYDVEASVTYSPVTGGVTGTTITDGGENYLFAPAVEFSEPPEGGVRAEGTAVLTGDAVTSITITNPGSGYTSAPTVTISPVEGDSGSGATATATIGTVAGTTANFSVTVTVS